MENKTYTFVHVPDRLCNTLESKETKDYIMKWSMKGSLQVQYYSFNQPFHVHKKEDFFNDFFTDPVVFSTLIYNQTQIGRPASCVNVESVPCTILSMDYFDRLLKEENGVTRCDGESIVQCHEEDVRGFLIDDNLRNVILNEESKYYKLYSDSERKQLLWRIFCHLCLGGQWCQYEFSIAPYLSTARDLYKELVSVERIGDSSELVVRSVVFKAKALDENNVPLVPLDPDNFQNFLYLIVDPFKRSVAVLSHFYGGAFMG